MKIKSITVANFKNVARTTLDLSKVVALVSPNNYGKSNLLEAIRFGLNFISYSSKSRNACMRQFSNIPLSPSLAGKDFEFSIEFDEPSLGQYRFMRYSYRFAWYNDQDTGAQITDEAIELRATESVKYTSFLKRQEGKYRPTKSSPSYRKLALGKDALAIDAIVLLDDVEITPAILALKNIGGRICDTLELDNSFHPDPIEFDFGDSGSLKNDDIPQTLALLKKSKPDLYEQYIDIIMELFPEFRKIELQKLTVQEEVKQELQKGLEIASTNLQTEATLPFRVRNELYRLSIDSTHLNQPISMEHMSTGTKRIFWLVANAVVAEFDGINLLGIDEVETSIHPKMLRALLTSLNEILGNSALIITSHSPYLIQYLKPQSIYVGIPNENGIACFRRIHDKKLKYLLATTRALQISIGEYLFDLMSGDSDSASILTSYLEAD